MEQSADGRAWRENVQVLELPIWPKDPAVLAALYHTANAHVVLELQPVVGRDYPGWQLVCLVTSPQPAST